MLICKTVILMKSFANLNSTWCADSCDESKDIHCFGQSESIACVMGYGKESEKQ